MSYFTYILYSPSKQRYYTGYTYNFTRRLSQHNAGKTPSSKHGIPWELAWISVPLDRSEALKLERKIKSRGAKRFLLSRRNNH